MESLKEEGRNKLLNYTIPSIPPTNNKYMGRTNKWEYQADKKEWAQLVSVYCRPVPKTPINKATVELKYFFPTRHRRDPDNYSGKFLLDGLVSAGVLVDDSFNNVHLVLRGDYDKENPRVEITITGVQE